MADDLISALSGNALADRLASRLRRFRCVIGARFFTLSEDIWEEVGSICLNLALLGTVLICLYVAIRIDSLSLLAASAGASFVLFILHIINRRLFKTFDQFAKGNDLIVTDYNLTDAFGVLALGPALCAIPISVYLFAKYNNPSALYIGTSTALVSLYIASFMLNPELLNIKMSDDASIGDNGITYLSIANGIGPARLSRLAYNIALLNGFLMFAHGFFEKVVSAGTSLPFSIYDLSSTGLAGIGLLVIVCAVLLPLPIYLYVTIVHVFIDALSSLIRTKNQHAG